MDGQGGRSQGLPETCLRGIGKVFSIKLSSKSQDSGTKSQEARNTPIFAKPLFSV